MLILTLSLFFTEAAPLDMPRAEAYLVREKGVSHLEDRYCRLDLWASQTMTGWWVDEENRQFILACLDTCPPTVDPCATVTRTEAVARSVAMERVRANRDFPKAFVDAVARLSPCQIAEKPRASRQLPRGYKDVCYWQLPTNHSTIVCTFCPERSSTWHLAVWDLADGDDYVTQMALFEDKFLGEEFPVVNRRREEEEGMGMKTRGRLKERDLLRRDARHSVAAYSNWHFTGAEEFAVLDDLPANGFVSMLTNDFAVMRAKYAAALPTPLDGSNVLCVARIYANREEYLESLERVGLTNMSWTAAYWCPQRRELVAYLPEGGERELLKTIRHEAFHQYLSYATAMISVSPWLNEGYAQYFEDESKTEWDDGVVLTEETLERLASAIPGILAMDYEQFYAGSDSERQTKYRLAWSIVRFIEKGADDVRLKPFAGLKGRYLKTLVDTHDMKCATDAAFVGDDLLRKFVFEWKKFWLKNR